jgi:2-polyprenyl-3-methyl-5-hydroxy-6-metoxy-1,4-benzoquinol methylase
MRLMVEDAPARIYSNAGNTSLIDLLEPDASRVLDVGCGAGDNAALIHSRFPDSDIFGVTHSDAERALAERHMRRCWVFDIESDFATELDGQTFDVIIFSHVLEHLRDPARVLARYRPLLRRGGTILVAVPNVLCWPQRWKFLRGRFEYESSGIMDDTHVRFFTYLTADKYLLSQIPDASVTYKGATGSVPLWILRRHLLPKSWSNAIDRWGTAHWPNLFGSQVLIKARV